jgi:hypothetical protein
MTNFYSSILVIFELPSVAVALETRQVAAVAAIRKQWKQLEPQ